MLSACYFGSKLENHRLHLDEFCSKVKNVSRGLLEELEFIFLEVFEYNIYIFTPLSAIIGHLMQVSLEVKYDLIVNLLEVIYRTDMCLLFTPQTIARFVLAKLYPDSFVFDDIPADLKDTDFENPKPLDKDLVKDIDKRIIEYRKK